jgi:hypothetical protein
MESLALVDVFTIPVRDWETLIKLENERRTGKKFQLTPLQCGAIIDYVKKGIPPQYIFKTLGISYSYYSIRYKELLDEVDILRVKETLSDKENKRFSDILNNPMFILMSDMERAEGASAIEDFSLLNEKCANNPEILLTKMRAKYKDIFSEKKDDSGIVNVNIKLGGDFADAI